MGRSKRGRDQAEQGFLRVHSLSLTTAAILVAWLLLNAKSDPRGLFFLVTGLGRG